MTVATTRPLTKAVLAALRATWSRVGEGVAPDDATLPYAVLYASGPGPLGGPVSDPHADGSPLLQLTCVGGTSEQAEALADRLRPVLLTRPTVTGQRVMQVILETSQPVRRDDSTSPPEYYAADQVRVLITPA